jgi:serine/threonine protein kinase
MEATVSRPDFVDQLRRTQLLSGPEMEQLAARFAGVRGPDAAAELVADGTLTRYQVGQLLAGQGARLRLGQYVLLDRLGEGGAGHVFKAVHPVLRRVVAIRIIAPEVVREPPAWAWFLREVRAAAQLHHPNVALASDVSEAEGVHFVVMEYVDGPALDTLVRSHGLMPVRLACRVFREAAAALQAAHQQGVIHRDIKPSNLLVPTAAGLVRERAWRDDPSGAGPLVKVVGFGLGRLSGPAGSEAFIRPTANGFLGTTGYVAPEQARGGHAGDSRSDVYGLGCTLHYALVGRPPFAGSSSVADPLDRIRPDVPRELAAAVRRMTAEWPDARFVTAAEVAAALAPWSDDPPSKPAAPFPTDGLVSCSPTSLAEIALAAGRAQAALPHGLSPVSRSELQLDPPAGALVPTLVDPPPVTAIDASVFAFASDGDFRRDWAAWAGVVGAYAEARPPGVTELAYHELHDRLVEACARRALGTDGEKRVFFRQLADLARPWLSLESLARAEPEAVRVLFARCREVESALGGRPRRAGALTWAAALVLGTLPLLAVSVSGDAAETNALGERLSWAERFRPSLSGLVHQLGANPLLWFTVVLPAVVLVSFVVMSRGPRG